jgi:TM2 domain-containing membrane protein YozV
MKKKLITAILAVSCVGLSFGSAFAEQTCNGVSITAVGTTIYTESGLFVKVKNVSGVDCGTTLTNGATVQYFLDTTNTDPTYATLLTALSLQKNLFIQVSGTGATNSLLLVTSIKN